jgi:hypothetical protein
MSGKFNMSNAKSDIDWLVYKAARLPGPGQSVLLAPGTYPRANCVTAWPGTR